MADIRQAAKWMQEGYRVKRTCQRYDIYTHATDENAPIFHLGTFDTAVFILGDLMADDWEIAE